MKQKIKDLILRFICGKPLLMSIYKDKDGNTYGGFIHTDDYNDYIDFPPSNFGEDLKYAGKIKIW